MKRFLEIILFCFLILLFVILIDFLRANKSQLDFYVGKNVVIDCDTLIVTGHSYRGYELSNGAACDNVYLEKYMIYE